MLFPSFFRGIPKDVYRENKKFVTKLKKNIDFFDFPQEEMITFNPCDERIALGKTSWHGVNIYLFPFFEEIYKTSNKEFIDNCYQKALESPWSILCLMGGFMSQTQLIFTQDSEKLYPFLAAINSRWEYLCSLGDVFMGLIPERKNIWTVNSNLKKVLALLNVPTERLLDKEIPQDLLKLVEK